MFKEFENTMVVEFFGLPEAGKTSTCSLLYDHLKNKDISFAIVWECVPELPMPLSNETIPMWAFAKFQDKLFTHLKLGVDLVILDRGIIDALLVINSRIDLSEETRKACTDYYKLFLSLVNLAFGFTVSIETSIQRRSPAKLSESRLLWRERLANEMNDLLQSNYIDDTTKKKIHFVDGENDFQENSRSIYEKIQRLPGLSTIV